MSLRILVEGAGIKRVVVLQSFAPDRVRAANAELLDVAFRRVVVVLNQVAPRLFLVARVLELSSPVGEPVADLSVGETLKLSQAC